MSPAHRKRCKRFDIPGDAHFLTFSCFRRLPLLAKDRTREWLVIAIDRARTRHPFDLWAFVFMPEHVHLVLLPDPNTKIASILNSIKQSVAKRAILWLRDNEPAFLADLEDIQPNGKRHHRFWQRGGGYDRNLRSVRDTHEKIRYVHENPVRRELVALPTDWKWSSARAWETGEMEPLSIDRESLPMLVDA